MCWCRSQISGHSHVSAYNWYEHYVPEAGRNTADHPKVKAWYNYAGIMYKLGITILY
jgi:hypothetical protein